MTKFEVTLKDLRKAGACYSGYNRLVRFLQGKPFTGNDDLRDTYFRFVYKDPISLLDILLNNGVRGAIWSLRCVTGGSKDARLFAVWCARQVQHLVASQESISSIDIAERFANGSATQEELKVAHRSSYVLERVDNAAAGARVAAYMASEVSAVDAAWNSSDSARDACWSLGWESAKSAEGYLGTESSEKAAQVAYDSCLEAQKEIFIAMCNGKAPWQ